MAAPCSFAAFGYHGLEGSVNTHRYKISICGAKRRIEVPLEIGEERMILTLPPDRRDPWDTVVRLE